MAVLINLGLMVMTNTLKLKRFPASQIPSNYKAFKEVNNEKREPTNYESVTDHKHSPFFKKKSQSCLVSKCIRLNEKEKYQRLLQLQCPQIWRNRGSVMAPPSSILTSLVAKEPDAHTVSSKSSSCDTSTPSSSSLLYIPSRKMLHESISKSHVRYRDKSSTVCSIDEQAASTEFRNSIFRPNVVREVMNSLKCRENKRKSSVEISEKNFNSEYVNSEPIFIIDDDDEPKNGVPAKPNQFNKGAQNQKSLESSAEKQVFQNSKYFDDKELEDKKQQRIAERERKNRLIEEEELKIAAYREKRRAQELFLEKKLKYQMRIFDDEPSVTEEIFREESETEKEEVLPVLTDEMQQTVDYALGPGNPNEILSEAFRLQITRRDIATLKGLNWLNDEVINFYMNMLIERGETNNGKVYAFNTFFYPKIMSGGHSAVKRWTKSVDIFSKKYIIIPVHLSMHWCLCIVNMEKKAITYYDSMGGKNPNCLRAVLNYLRDESIAKNQPNFKENEWQIKHAEDNPQQMNGGDCGMFMCKYAEYITRGKEITFTQEHMPYFRRRMVYEIISKKLLQ
ncbi:SUMO1 sentrin specific peptidase 1 [Bulinus truncatus]|nr:SUMO1 sentrin specific peptidase 1 [Bulinus truncatus]